jgi:DNA-binding NarL/FixJ family response regulator
MGSQRLAGITLAVKPNPMAYTRYYFGNQYLTPKEAQVTSLIRRCHNTKQMASMYGNSDETIETTIKNIANKINTRTRPEMVVWAIDNGFDKTGFLNGIDLFKGVELIPLPLGFEPRCS